MEQPVQDPGASASTPDSGGASPYVLSRDYEDYLDWLENQRRDRTKRTGRRRPTLAFVSLLAATVTLAGTMMRRR